MMKNDLLELLHHCSDQQFGQDAAEWAIASGFVMLTYDRGKDLRIIVGEPGKPETVKLSKRISGIAPVTDPRRFE